MRPGCAGRPGLAPNPQAHRTRGRPKRGLQGKAPPVLGTPRPVSPSRLPPFPAPQWRYIQSTVRLVLFIKDLMCQSHSNLRSH